MIRVRWVACTFGQCGRGRQILRACSLEVRGQGTELYLQQHQGISARSCSCVLKLVSKKTSLVLLPTLSFLDRYRVGAFRLGAQARELGHLVKNGCPSPKHRDAPLMSPGRQGLTKGAFAHCRKNGGFGKVRKFSDSKYMKFHYSSICSVFRVLQM